MKLRITSNGSGQGSRVQNMETGEYLPGVRHVDISIPLDGPVIAKIEVAGVEVDVATLIQDPLPEAEPEVTPRESPAAPSS